ncbi:AMP-binding protein [Bradyrhizobium sp. HKCCYLS2038]|uniref:AMP-binding protein n=1 Tax=unclassified Bradyrhizobium TaxID=2631580 RepID=UPI003EBCA5DA
MAIETLVAADSNDNPAARRRHFKRGVSLATWARLAGDRTALHCSLGDRSFAELDDNCSRLAHVLLERGIGADDGLALICGNRPEFVETTLAAERAGIRVTPIRADLTAREVDYLLEDSGAKAVIADGSIAGPLADMLGHQTGRRATLTIGTTLPGAEDYHSALARAATAAVSCEKVGIPLIYTSGTTGAPKGVYRREPVSLSTQVAVGRRLKLSASHDFALAPLALCRPGVFNLSVRLPLVCGVPVLLTEKYDPLALLALIAENRITYAYLTPFLLHRLAQLPPSLRSRYDISSLRNVLHTGAPCAVGLKREIIDWFGPIITECYSGTEGGDIVISSDEWIRKPGSVGKASDRVAILDDAGRELPVGTIGRVFLDAPERGRFEYFNDPEKTRSAYCGDRYTMGDHGYLDADGYLFLTGRSAEIINCGGLKIYPAEVDAILVSHPAVADAACIGVAHPEMGEEVLALVTLAAGYTEGVAVENELRSHCAALLAPYKCPKRYQFVGDIPRLPTGKILREALRRRHAASAAQADDGLTVHPRVEHAEEPRTHY